MVVGEGLIDRAWSMVVRIRLNGQGLGYGCGVRLNSLGYGCEGKA